MTAEPGLDDALFAALVDRSRATNLQRIAGLTTLLQTWHGTGSIDPGQRRQVVELAHQVVGSAGTFGFEAVSELGRRLEVVVGDTPDPDAEQLEQWLELASSMEHGLTV